MATERAGAVIVLVDSTLIDHRTRIADLAARRRLPTVSGPSDTAEAGGLIAYGPSARCPGAGGVVDPAEDGEVKGDRRAVTRSVEISGGHNRMLLDRIVYFFAH